MAAIECGKGHLYDPGVYSTCPYCNTNSKAINLGTPVGDIGKTVPLNQNTNIPVVTAPGVTHAPLLYQPAGKAVVDQNKTMSLMDKRLGHNPVVGWIVCVKGATIGKDYPLRGQINTIGRSEKMDIAITGDKTISNENHAKLGYSPKNRRFHIIPADSKNLIYLNDSEVFAPTELKAYDRLEFGDTTFIFIPFCGEDFSWD